MDAHLEAVPGLGALAVGGLAGGDLEGAAGQADGALDAQLLALGAVDQLAAHLLEGLDLAGGEGDADLVGFLYKSRVRTVFYFVVVDATVDGRRERTGASPKSFSGLLYDMLTVFGGFGVWL